MPTKSKTQDFEPPSGHPEAGGQTSLDQLLGGRIRLRQPLTGYRVAVDPVLLAAAIEPMDAQQILDLGCGTGAVGLCILARANACHVTGLEIDPLRAKMAAENARLNNLADRMTVTLGDILSPPLDLPALVDWVVMNPPYLPIAKTDPARPRDPSRVEMRGTLADWLAAGLSRLKHKGGLALIHRADRLHEILGLLTGPAGDITVYPIWPKPGAAANRVIVKARKGTAGGTTLCSGLCLHQSDGSFTALANQILREGMGLPGMGPAPG